MTTARLGSANIVLPHFAMIDVEPGMVFTSRSFEERCEAAAAGGFDGIGIAHTLYFAERDAGRSDADLRAMARTHGVVVSEIESIAMPGPASRSAFEEQLARVFAAAAVFEASSFFVIAVDGVSIDQHVETFAWLAEQCAEHGLRVGLEFMDIPGLCATRDLASAHKLVDRAGHPNGGLCLDTYHYFNSTSDWDDLRAVDGEQIVMIQLSDGRLPPASDDYVQETLHHRLPPGEGDFDLAQFVGVVRGLGAGCPWSVEVLNDDLRTLSPADVGRRLGASARATLTS